VQFNLQEPANLMNGTLLISHFGVMSAQPSESRICFDCCFLAPVPNLDSTLFRMTIAA